MNFTKDTHFRGLKINETEKGVNGYYTPLLEAIFQLQTRASFTYERPLCAHITIDNPVEDALQRIVKELARWYAAEAKEVSICNIPPLYFACLETTPRTKNRHLHILVWFGATGDNSVSLKLLSRRLKKLSRTKKATLHKRKPELRAPDIDKRTGMERVSHSGRIKRSGSPYYHDLNNEFEDAFKRGSYLAKVFSKTELPQRGVSFGHSRPLKEAPSIPHLRQAQATPSDDTACKDFDIFLDALTAPRPRLVVPQPGRIQI